MLSNRKNKLWGLVLLVLILAVGFWLLRPEPVAELPETNDGEEVEVAEAEVEERVIGKSVGGRNLTAYSFGNGATNLLFVGGIHGGYEWNSSLLAYEMIDHFTTYPELIPEDLTVTIVPVANPDGLYQVTGSGARFALADITEPTVNGTGRFNLNDVDLNRNFDCKWEADSTWRGAAVSAGTEPFSEPEAAALRDLVLEIEPVAVVFWHSQANAVYASECESGILPDTLAVMSTYANAAGYKTVESFDAYPITGDAEGWLASIGIPAITVELSTHDTVEWSKNLAGTKALMEHFGNTLTK